MKKDSNKIPFVKYAVTILLAVYSVYNYRIEGLSSINFTLFSAATFTLILTLSYDRLLVFGYGLPVIFNWIATLHYLKHGVNNTSTVFYLLAVTVLLITIFHKKSLECIYHWWMKVAHFIGHVITSILLIIFYYLVFAPLGILFRIIRKDFLDRKISPEVSSYWIYRENKPFEPDQCKRQF